MANPYPCEAAEDLILLTITRGKPETVQVSSKAMSLASPVWRTMLDPKGPFREASPDNGEISFLEDDADALLILLLATHLKYQEIPEELTYEMLLNVCVACDTFDRNENVGPWLSKWLSHLTRYEDGDGVPFHWLSVWRPSYLRTC